MKTAGELVKMMKTMLDAMHPASITKAEAERVQLSELLFNREARVSLRVIIEEFDRLVEYNRDFDRENSALKDKIRDLNRQLKLAREKNSKLKAKR
jgi:hypothetical protein